MPKILASFVALCMLVTSVDPGFASISKASATKSLPNASLTEDLPDVILIQDAHSIPEAQKSIFELIKSYQEKGVSIVAAEGAQGLLDANFLRSYPDKKHLHQIMNDYFARAEISGVTAAAVLSPYEAEYHGIEDWNLYQEGLTHFLDALKDEEETLNDINAERESLQRQKENFYSPQLLKVDQAIQEFQGESKNLIEILQILSEVKKPAVSSLKMLLEESMTQPENKFELEVRRAADNVIARSEATKQSSIIEFNQQKQLFDTSQISAAEFATYLKTINPQLKFSNELQAKSERHKKLRELQGTEIFEELERYMDDVKESLFENETQRNLDQKARELYLREKLAKLELTRKEYDELQLKSLFYQNAVAREKAFFENIMLLRGAKRRSNLESNSIIVVTGGFHSQGLIHHFNKNDLTYELITPTIKSLPKENIYRAQMKGEVSWKQHFQYRKGKASPYEAFMRGVREELLKDKTSLKLWRDEIVRGAIARERITRAGEYTRFLDEVISRESNSFLKGMAKVEKFIHGLEQLQHANQISPQNVLKLFQPATRVPDMIGAQLSPTNFVTAFSELREKQIDRRDVLNFQENHNNPKAALNPRAEALYERWYRLFRGQGNSKQVADKLWALARQETQELFEEASGKKLPRSEMRGFPWYDTHDVLVEKDEMIDVVRGWEHDRRYPIRKALEKLLGFEDALEVSILPNGDYEISLKLTEDSDLISFKSKGLHRLSNMLNNVNDILYNTGTGGNFFLYLFATLALITLGITLYFGFFLGGLLATKLIGSIFTVVIVAVGVFFYFQKPYNSYYARYKVQQIYSKFQKWSLQENKNPLPFNQRMWREHVEKLLSSLHGQSRSKSQISILYILSQLVKEESETRSVTLDDPDSLRITDAPQWLVNFSGDLGSASPISTDERVLLRPWLKNQRLKDPVQEAKDPYPTSELFADELMFFYRYLRSRLTIQELSRLLKEYPDGTSQSEMRAGEISAQEFAEALQGLDVTQHKVFRHLQRVLADVVNRRMKFPGYYSLKFFQTLEVDLEVIGVLPYDLSEQAENIKQQLELAYGNLSKLALHYNEEFQMISIDDHAENLAILLHVSTIQEDGKLLEALQDLFKYEDGGYNNFWMLESLLEFSKDGFELDEGSIRISEIQDRRNLTAIRRAIDALKEYRPGLGALFDEELRRKPVDKEVIEEYIRFGYSLEIRTLIRGSEGEAIDPKHEKWITIGEIDTLVQKLGRRFSEMRIAESDLPDLTLGWSEGGRYHAAFKRLLGDAHELRVHRLHENDYEVVMKSGTSSSKKVFRANTPEKIRETHKLLQAMQKHLTPNRVADMLMIASIGGLISILYDAKFLLLIARIVFALLVLFMTPNYLRRIYLTQRFFNQAFKEKTRSDDVINQDNAERIEKIRKLFLNISKKHPSFRTFQVFRALNQIDDLEGFNEQKVFIFSESFLQAISAREVEVLKDWAIYVKDFEGSITYGRENRGELFFKVMQHIRDNLSKAEFSNLLDQIERPASRGVVDLYAELNFPTQEPGASLLSVSLSDLTEGRILGSFHLVKAGQLVDLLTNKSDRTAIVTNRKVSFFSNAESLDREGEVLTLPGDSAIQVQGYEVYTGDRFLVLENFSASKHPFVHVDVKGERDHLTAESQRYSAPADRSVLVLVTAGHAMMSIDDDQGQQLSTKYVEAEQIIEVPAGATFYFGSTDSSYSRRTHRVQISFIQFEEVSAPRSEVRKRVDVAAPAKAVAGAILENGVVSDATVDHVAEIVKVGSLNAFAEVLRAEAQLILQKTSQADMTRSQAFLAQVVDWSNQVFANEVQGDVAVALNVSAEQQMALQEALTKFDGDLSQFHAVLPKALRDLSVEGINKYFISSQGRVPSVVIAQNDRWMPVVNSASSAYEKVWSPNLDFLSIEAEGNLAWLDDSVRAISENLILVTVAAVAASQIKQLGAEISSKQKRALQSALALKYGLSDNFLTVGSSVKINLNYFTQALQTQMMAASEVRKAA